MPLPAPDPDEVMPADLQQLAGYMRQSYSGPRSGGVHQLPGLAGRGLPDDLLDEAAIATPITTRATRPAKGRAMSDAASTAQRVAEPSPGPDRRHHYLAVPAARGAGRLAAVLDPDECIGMHLFWKDPGLAHSPANVAVRAGAPVQPFHAQRSRAGRATMAHELVDTGYEWVFVRSGLLGA